MINNRCKNKFKGVLFLILPFLYFISLGLIGVCSYDIIDTVHSMNKISDFKYTVVDSVIGRPYRIMSEISESYTFIENQDKIPISILDTSHLGDKYIEIDYFDSGQIKSVNYKHVPVYYSSTLKKAYHLNSGNLNKKILFKKISWKIYSIIITVIVTFVVLFILRNEIIKWEKEIHS